jgi:F-type H+-transporting ATPase subunit b
MELLHEGEFWVAVGFVLVILLLVWKGAPGMIARMLDARAAAIDAELEEARRLNAEAAALLNEYRQRAAGAETEAEAILANARAEAARFAEESRKALAAQIDRRTLAARDKITQAEAAALNEIRALAADAAIAAAQKLIVARLDEARAGKLIEGAIKDLGDKLN